MREQIARAAMALVSRSQSTEIIEAITIESIEYILVKDRQSNDDIYYIKVYICCMIS